MKAYIDAHERTLADIRVLAENAAQESRLIEGLKNQQMENRFSSSAAEKGRLLEELEVVQKREARELQEEVRQRVGDVEVRKLRAQSEAEVLEEKVRILKAEEANLESQKTRLTTEHEASMEDLMGQLEKAERKSRLNAAAAANGGHKDEDWFGCPVCLMLLSPPTRIFQCPEGHTLCEECKENPAMVHCPQCR